MGVFDLRDLVSLFNDAAAILRKGYDAYDEAPGETRAEHEAMYDNYHQPAGEWFDKVDDSRA